VTASNIVFECDTRREEIESDFAKIPPCTIEKRITLDDKEYPIVRSHHVPDDNEWNSSWDDINRQVLLLINLGHGDFSPDPRIPLLNFISFSSKDESFTNLGSVSYG